MTDSVGLDPALSARRLLRVLSAGAGFDRRRVEDVLQLTEAHAYANRPIRQLSTGMRQRVALAVALLGDPPLLLLDEPVNGLDPDSMRWFRSFIRGVAASGRSVVLSSHLLDEVEQSVDRVVLLRQRVLFVGQEFDLSRQQERVAFLVEQVGGPGEVDRFAVTTAKALLRREEVEADLIASGFELVTEDGASAPGPSGPPGAGTFEWLIGRTVGR